MAATHITIIFLVTLTIKILLTYYLDYRNLANIKRHRNKVPINFLDLINLCDHQKAADYCATKIKVGFLFRFISLILLLFWTIGGGIELNHQFVMSFDLNNILTGTLFFVVIGTISIIISIPQTAYMTFVVEEKFGFNKTTLKTFITDLLKEILLSIIIGIPILMAILLIMKKMGQHWWLYTFLFLTLIQLIMVFIYPRFIAPLFNKFTPLDDGEIKDTVQLLLKRTSFKENGLFIMDASKRSKHGNAYFYGFGKAKRIVLFDTLLDTLNSNEVEAVLAHEIGHFKKKHIIKGLFTSLFFSFVAFFLLGIFYKWDLFYLGHGVKSMSTWTGLSIFFLVSPIYTFLSTPLFSWFSRKNEFEADDYASTYSSAEYLITSLKKMYRDNSSTLTPDPVYSKFYHSHPPAIERINNLIKLQKEKNK